MLAIGIAVSKGDGCSKPRRRSDTLERSFDVLRIYFAAVHNDQVLEPARQVEFSTFDETKIARAKVAAFACKGVAEAARIVRSSTPIPRRNAGSAQPDLAHMSVRQCRTCIRRYDR